MEVEKDEKEAKKATNSDFHPSRSDTYQMDLIRNADSVPSGFSLMSWMMDSNEVTERSRNSRDGCYSFFL